MYNKDAKIKDGFHMEERRRRRSEKQE